MKEQETTGMPFFLAASDLVLQEVLGSAQVTYTCGFNYLQKVTDLRSQHPDNFAPALSTNFFSRCFSDYEVAPKSKAISNQNTPDI
jgi:hypothetical protein